MATFPRGFSTRDIDNTPAARDHTVATLEAKITWAILAADAVTLRGIPAIGHGVAGQIPGTRPDQRAA